MPPRIRLGSWRADGYTDPSGSWISGPRVAGAGPARRGVQQRVDAARAPLHIRVGHDDPLVGVSPELSDRAVHCAAVAEVGSGGVQPHARVALDRGLRCPVGGAVVGHQDADGPLGRVRQRGQKTVQMHARRIGHRDHGQDVTHALRVTVEAVQREPLAPRPAHRATAAAATDRPSATADRTAPSTPAARPAAGCGHCSPAAPAPGRRRGFRTPPGSARSG